MADFTMPALGADMETGKIVQWHVKPGDPVKSGDVVAVVETHKGAIDVECFLDGVINNLAPPDVELPVGAVLATVHTADTAGTATVKPTAPPDERVRLSPAARRRARERSLSLDAVPGKPADGVVARTVTKTGFDPTQMRQAIAAAMGRSKREIPHYYLSSTIDFGTAQTWLEVWNHQREPIDRLLPAVLMLKATAKALVEVPQLNGFYENGAYRAAPAIHLGWAVALRGGGLVAPAIHDAHQKTLPELMAALRDLVQRARAGGLRSSELTDPTITVTSLGERGAESVLGVIYPPQVAIVGFGRVVQRPWVLAGQVVPRALVTVSLAADHRASDGHVGGQLLAAIDTALQSPDQL
jgi:pyruvate dehydrogenase E2 component (dihydrolipoamide acetyltransferase)